MGAGGEVEAAPDGALPRAPRRGTLLLRPDCHHRHAAGSLLCGGNDAVSFARQIQIFDYPRFAEPLRDRVRERAAELAGAAGMAIELVAKVLAVRGEHPGLVHIISAMEACNTCKPWHDKQTHRTFLRPDTGKCLHYCGFR